MKKRIYGHLYRPGDGEAINVKLDITSSKILLSFTDTNDNEQYEASASKKGGGHFSGKMQCRTIGWMGDVDFWILNVSNLHNILFIENDISGGKTQWALLYK
jgi:hypothetical protein